MEDVVKRSSIMVGAYYDIEAFANYISFLFVNMTNDQKWIDAYIDADINHDENGKREALYHIDYRNFIFHQDQFDSSEFYEFMSNIKLLIGFNSIRFDDLLVMKMFIIKDLVIKGEVNWRVIDIIKQLSDSIIENGDVYYKYVDDELKGFTQWWQSVDLFAALFESVERKSLKQSGINIKWYRIEDLPMRPDARVEKSDFPKIFEYNLNDVLITRELHIRNKNLFKLRINLMAKYNVNVLTNNKSTIADKLMMKFYSEKTGLRYYEFKDKRTYRTLINFGEILNPKIGFYTSALQSVHEELLNTSFYVGNKFQKIVLFKNKGYKIATGGLHSIDRPGKFEVDGVKMLLRDGDVNSYYPALIYNEGVCPAHLASVAFSQIVNMIMTDRLNYKALIKPLKKEGRYAEAEDAQTGADGLKIVANSGLFGKLGYDGWLLDAKAMYQVTLNGQLYLMMWIERLEEAGIEVISANTDGILARFSASKLDDYTKIANEWQALTKLGLEFTEYIKYVRTSVNSYLAIKKGWLTDPLDEDNIKRKDEFLTEVLLSKGFNAPIIALALNEYYINGIPIETTIKNHKDIYDYCISVKTGPSFDKQLHTISNGIYDVTGLSKNLRYFVSTDGGTLLKHSRNKEGLDKYANMIKGVLITPFNDYFRVNEMKDYHINYQYYIKRATDMILRINGEFSKATGSRVFKGSKKKGVTEIGKLFDNIE